MTMITSLPVSTKEMLPIWRIVATWAFHHDHLVDDDEYDVYVVDDDDNDHYPHADDDWLVIRPLILFLLARCRQNPLHPLLATPATKWG